MLLGFRDGQKMKKDSLSCTMLCLAIRKERKERKERKKTRAGTRLRDTERVFSKDWLADKEQGSYACKLLPVLTRM
jgi:hypothetical protein